MFKNLEIFRTAQSMATHAAARQSTVAGNIAHADTPGYKAQTITDFKDIMRDAPMNVGLKTTRASHIRPSMSADSYRVMTDTNAPSKPNGNTVSIEEQTLQSIEAERQHSKALAIYQSSLNILKTSLGRGR